MVRAMRVLFVAAMLAAGAGSCGDSEEASPEARCRDQFGYHDPMDATATAPETTAQLGARCVAEGGSDCEPTKFISRGAAECIARDQKLVEGISPWESRLIYNYKF